MPDYRLRYHRGALADVAAGSRNMQLRLQQVALERLAVDPLRFGEVLARDLSGLRKLRVGAYRIVYEVRAQEVRIFGIDHRRKVYPRLRARARRPFRDA